MGMEDYDPYGKDRYNTTEDFKENVRFGLFLAAVLAVGVGLYAGFECVRELVRKPAPPPEHSELSPPTVKKDWREGRAAQLGFTFLVLTGGGAVYLYLDHRRKVRSENEGYTVDQLLENVDR